MFKRKPKPLSSLLPVKEADVTIAAFRKDVAEAATKYGVDCYALLIEFPALNEKGERGHWLSRMTSGPDLQVVGLIAWSYGEFRGRVDQLLSTRKQNGMNVGQQD